MPDYPQTRHDMVRAGYKHLGNGVCKGCSADIEWWETAKKKKLPMNRIVNDHDLAKTHWETCPNSKEFKGAASTPATPVPGRFDLLDREVRQLRDRLDARMVVLIDDHGTHASWRVGLPGEDLRHDLISAGNFVRDTIRKGDPTL